MNLFLDVLLPLGCLTINLRIWRLIYLRGWNQLFPVLSGYIGFSCLSTLFVLPLAYWRWYPQHLQKALCLVYLYSYHAIVLANLAFFIVVTYELFAYMVRSHPEGRRSVKLVFLSAGVILAVLVALVCMGYIAWGSRGFEQVASGVENSEIVVLIGLIAALLLLKRGFGVRWSWSISLIVLAPALYFLLQMILLLVAFQYGKPGHFASFISQIAALIWVVLWWVAVRHAPHFGLAAEGN